MNAREQPDQDDPATSDPTATQPTWLYEGVDDQDELVLTGNFDTSNRWSDGPWPEVAPPGLPLDQAIQLAREQSEIVVFEIDRVRYSAGAVSAGPEFVSWPVPGVAPHRRFAHEPAIDGRFTRWWVSMDFKRWGRSTTETAAQLQSNALVLSLRVSDPDRPRIDCLLKIPAAGSVTQTANTVVEDLAADPPPSPDRSANGRGPVLALGPSVVFTVLEPDPSSRQPL